MDLMYLTESPFQARESLCLCVTTAGSEKLRKVFPNKVPEMLNGNYSFGKLASCLTKAKSGTIFGEGFFTVLESTDLLPSHLYCSLPKSSIRKPLTEDLMCQAPISAVCQFKQMYLFCVKTSINKPKHSKGTARNYCWTLSPLRQTQRPVDVY